MARARSGAVAVALLALTAILAGCIATPPVQLSAAQRSHIRIGLADAEWASVSVNFPGANRPQLAVLRTIDDHDWPETVASCLRESGFNVVSSADDYQYLGRPGQAPISFAVANYSCLVDYPKVSDLVPFLGRGQIDALYFYYVASVRPCLLAAGIPSGAPPTRFAFVTSIFTRESWHPFQRAWDSQLPASQLRYAEQLCQPVPKWLDLRTSGGD
jgi:hypothetical protein